MVTLTLGKKWQNQVEEIANLKSENQELLEELHNLKQKNQQLTEESTSNHNLSYRLDLKNKQLQNKVTQLEAQLKEANSKLQETDQFLFNKEQQSSSLQSQMLQMQKRIDQLQSALSEKDCLVSSLKNEIQEGEKHRELLEDQKEKWLAEAQKLEHSLQVMTRAKEHSDKHMAILVKEKDRLLCKKDEPSVVTKEYQPLQPQLPVKTKNSWAEVEVLRLKKLLEQTNYQVSQKDQTIQKLQKENWNLLNRLRNKK